MQITFLPHQIEAEAEPGESLLLVASRAGIFIDASCGGKASCGKCKVIIESGEAGALTVQEKELLTQREIEAKCRLACHIKVQEDLLVRVPERKSAASRKSKLLEFSGELHLEPLVQKEYLELSSPSLENQEGDLERLQSALGRELTIPLLLLKSLPGLLNQEKQQVTVCYNRKNQIIDLEGGNTAEHCYGLAFDIGTTTVVGMLWDLNEGKLVGIHSRNNPQGIYGADVISRICFAGMSEENLDQIHDKMIDCFNEIIELFRQENHIEPDWIYDMTVVGNTTMSHLFLGVDPISMAKAPFNPVFCSPQNVKAMDMGIHICPFANVHLLPNIAGHVGSDITAGLVGTGIMESHEAVLFIDVGTNGEIVLSGGNRVLTASTAAGPAFEGASIYNGMRASTGAIEAVEIQDGQVSLTVIDGGDPVGICGSGLIDAVAEMLQAGLILKTGKLLDQEEALQQGIPESLASRLIRTEQGKAFVLGTKKTGDPILLTQNDIRELQLAKGAIDAGIQIMLQMLDLEIQDISKVSIAGAFGSYINKFSAVQIGLFPALDPGKIVSIGNQAGVGAVMCLLSATERKKAEKAARKIEHVELALHPDFQKIYMKSMYFPTV